MRHGKARFVTGFLAVPVLVYLFYVVWPFAQAAGYSFTDWGGYSQAAPGFVGLDNYARLLKDELFQTAFWHNVFFLITVPLLTIALALFFAFLLNVGGRGNRAGVQGVWGSSLYKVIFFFPQVLSLVVIAVMWQQIYRGDGQGLINNLLIKLGVVDPQNPITFTGDPQPFLGIPAVLWWLLLIAIWRGVEPLQGHLLLPPGALAGRHRRDVATDLPGRRAGPDQQPAHQAGRGRPAEPDHLHRRPAALPRDTRGALVAAADRDLGRRRLLHGVVLRGHAIHSQGPLRGGAAGRRRARTHVLPDHPAPAARHDLRGLGLPGLHRAGHVRAGLRHDAEPGRPEPHQRDLRLNDQLHGVQQGRVRLRLRHGRGTGDLRAPAGGGATADHPPRADRVLRRPRWR